MNTKTERRQGTKVPAPIPEFDCHENKDQREMIKSRLIFFIYVAHFFGAMSSFMTYFIRIRHESWFNIKTKKCAQHTVSALHCFSKSMTCLGGFSKQPSKTCMWHQSCNIDKMSTFLQLGMPGNNAKENSQSAFLGITCKSW